MTAYLADTSAWHRSGRGSVAVRWRKLLTEGLLRTCSPVRLELLYSARDTGDYEALRDQLTSIRDVPLSAPVVERAEEIQAGLANRGHHRGPAPVDLYIAAAAELHRVTLLHYDRHFDAIAEITGQPAEWIAPRGTID